MKILVAEDDYASSIFMERFLSEYGECEIAKNGIEAVSIFLAAVEAKEYFDLVCLDIIMPKLDGIKVLKTIKDIEKEYNVDEDCKTKIIMTTALNDKDSVVQSFENGCDTYVWKPIDIHNFVEKMKELKLI